jgi:hypothetical protein
MSDPGATLDAKKLAAGAIDEYREDLLSLQRLIALLDGLRPRLGSLDDKWLGEVRASRRRARRDLRVDATESLEPISGNAAAR